MQTALRRLHRVTGARTMSSYKYVVVGAGNSAGYAARAFDAAGVPGADVCLIGTEPVAPYERPALSKGVLLNAGARLPGFHTCVGVGAERQGPEWYAERGVTLMLGKTVTDFDATAKTVTLDDGSSVSATDAVVLATGAEPIRLTRTPGHDLRGVYYLRDNDDALSLYDALQENIGKTVIVVGGGYIGMEVSSAALTIGCKVTMVFPEDHIMPRLFTPEIAAYYERVYVEKGATLVKNGRLCKAFLGDDAGNIRGIMTCQEGAEDQEIAGSMVVVGVGARATTTLFKGKLDMDERGGVKVDSALKTSADGVYAIGDIATFPLKMYGDRPVRVEHVQNARDSANHVVNAIVAGSAEPYDYLPYFYSRIFDLSWQFFGDSVGECLVVGDFAPKLLAIWVEGESAVKGIFMEHPSAEDTANMKTIARDGCTVDVVAFKKCSSVEEGWALLL